MKASIPVEALHPFWDDEYRKSWGVELKFSSSAREIFQVCLFLELSSYVFMSKAVDFDYCDSD